MLAELECRNTGKPIVEAEYDIADVATCFEYYGGLANESHGPRQSRSCQRRSASLCANPWASRRKLFPGIIRLLMAAWKLAPAIAAGCCCVLKPAEQTPLTALEFAN